MIIEFTLDTIITVLNVILSWLPDATTLPQIVGADLDGSLVTAVSFLRRIMEVYWFLGIIFDGFLFLLVYYITKMVLKLFLASRLHNAGH